MKKKKSESDKEQTLSQESEMIIKELDEQSDAKDKQGVIKNVKTLIKITKKLKAIIERDEKQNPKIR